MNHRRRPERGHRPRGRFAAGSCRSCGEGFVIDRAVQPWARARTCSEVCAKRLGNAGRGVLSCEHCLMVESYTHERQRQEIALENELRADEDAHRGLVVFGTWLRHYPWPVAA